MLAIDPHPLFEPGVFITRFAAPLAELPTPPWLTEWLGTQRPAPMQSNDQVRAAVRDLLRSGGFKPTGRSKPASEYLLRAAAEGTLGSINLAVDACNAVSLHSGLPISVVDLELVREPLRVQVAGKGDRYVFNAAGQEIELSGLLCLFDADGPCANGVKDAQRSKTHPGTRQTLSVVWGTRALSERTAAATRWYRELLERAGAATEPA
jgi:DNA/RNA-binding domain of Phe-tRNA-synthetase-like protein